MTFQKGACFHILNKYKFEKPYPYSWDYTPDEATALYQRNAQGDVCVYIVSPIISLKAVRIY